MSMNNYLAVVHRVSTTSLSVTVNKVVQGPGIEALKISSSVVVSPTPRLLELPNSVRRAAQGSAPDRKVSPIRCSGARGMATYAGYKSRMLAL